MTQKLVRSAPARAKLQSRQSTRRRLGDQWGKVARNRKVLSKRSTAARDKAMLGTLLAILSAASFAATNAAARRGVVTGAPAQGMVLTNPVGVICFSVVAIAAGELTGPGDFSLPAAAWMAGVGVLHFICGRYANFRANQSAGTNLTAPVIQLNSVVTLVLAVVLLGEPCTVLQVIGGITMISGALVAQRQVPMSISAGPLRFSPRKAEGFLFAVFAALAYGTTPIMTRTALQSAGPSGAIIGGLIAYGAATVVVVIMLLSSAVLRRNLMLLKQESVRWFVYSGVLVAVAQGFLYSAVSVAPIMSSCRFCSCRLCFVCSSRRGSIQSTRSSGRGSSWVASFRLQVPRPSPSTQRSSCMRWPSRMRWHACSPGGSNFRSLDADFGAEGCPGATGPVHRMLEGPIPSSVRKATWAHVKAQNLPA